MQGVNPVSEGDAGWVWPVFFFMVIGSLDLLHPFPDFSSVIPRVRLRAGVRGRWGPHCKVGCKC